jgi:hypothetical protein
MSFWHQPNLIFAGVPQEKRLLAGEQSDTSHILVMEVAWQSSGSSSFHLSECKLGC